MNHQSDGGFLFATFRNEDTPMTEQVYFAISDDGREWQALNGGDPVLISDVGETGVRDPFLVRLQDGRGVVLIATDLSNHLNPDWTRAQEAGSRSIVIWESADLVHWSSPRLVSVAPEDAGCAWAPEAIYDARAGDYLMFWASRTRRDHFAKHRIWARRTPDFRTFSEPFIYIDKPHDIIDTDIIRDGDTYYRFSKDGEHKTITMECSRDLQGDWEKVPGFSLGTKLGFEGPLCFQLPIDDPGKPAAWCLLIDRFLQGKGYEPFACRDLSSGLFAPVLDWRVPFPLRQGGVLRITAAESARLLSALGGRHHSGGVGSAVNSACASLAPGAMGAKTTVVVEANAGKPPPTPRLQSNLWSPQIPSSLS